MTQFKNIDGLITFKDKDGVDRYLGYLINFNGHGVFDASLGKVDITPEEIDRHNAILTESQLKGLDENCEIGQWGTFYYTGKDGNVTTFTGEVVSNRVWVSGEKRFTIKFERNGRMYRGVLQKDADCFNFRRIA